MNIRVLFFSSLVLFFSAQGCLRNESNISGAGTAENSIIIKGVLEDGQGNEVILEEMGAREFIPLDTVKCNDSGSFEFSVSAGDVAFYVLRYGSAGYITLLLEPGEVIEFEGTLENKESYLIKGSRGSELLQKLSSEHKHTLNALSEITRRNMELVSSPDYPTLKSGLDRQFDSITNRFYEYSLQFIQENAGSLAILVALYNLYGQGLPVFTPEKDLHVYQFVDSALMSKYTGFEAVDLLNAQLREAEQVLYDEGKPNKLQKGEIAPDFVSSRTDGSQLALSDFRGNYVLLSFWAGWSRLSREENPTLKRAQESFGHYNFRILQVSFDDNREVWTAAIQEEELDWEHVSELKRWDSPVADLYHIEKIPGNVLVDPAGRIIETDLFGERLIEKLELIFTK